MEFEDVFVAGKVGKSKNMEDILTNSADNKKTRKTMKMFSET